MSSLATTTPLEADTKTLRAPRKSVKRGLGGTSHITGVFNECLSALEIPKLFCDLPGVSLKRRDTQTIDQPAHPHIPQRWLALENASGCLPVRAPLQCSATPCHGDTSVTLGSQLLPPSAAVAGALVGNKARPPPSSTCYFFQPRYGAVGQEKRTN